MMEAVTGKLSRIEDLLGKIEESGRTSKEEVWHKPRKEVDGQQVEVRIRCNIISVGDIDNVAQEFKAEFYLQASWREPALKGMERESVDWDSQWDPRIIFVNAVALDKCTTKHHLIHEDNDPVPTVKLGYRVIGTFKEKLELIDFPFDSQELTVQIMSDWPATDVKFCKDQTIKDSIRIDTFTASHSWTLRDHVISNIPVPTKEESGSHRVYPKYEIQADVVRKPGYYIWNVAFIMLLIMILTFASLVVDPTEPADRLSVTLTLLLTSVAFKFVVSQNLPTISYLTILDKYVLCCMVFQALMVLQNSCASLWPSREEARTFDWISALVLLFCLIVVHLVFIISAAVKVKRRNRKLSKKKQDYQILCARINKWYQEHRANKVQPLEHQQQPPEQGSLQKTDIPHHLKSL